MSTLDALDKIYTSSRYPGTIGMLAAGKPTKAEAAEFYENAKQIYEMILKILEK